MKKIFPFLFISTLLLSVNGVAQEPTQMEKVIKTHDILMAKMPGLVKLINALQTKANNSDDKAQYEIAIEDLGKANRAMQNWMSGFGKRFDVDEMLKGKKLSEEKQKWLGEEEEKINALQEQIDRSLVDGKKLLDKD